LRILRVLSYLPVLFFVGLILAVYLFAGGGQGGGLFALFLLIVFLIVLVIFIIAVLRQVRYALMAASRRRQNTADGVIASWQNVRMTQTELIDGYKPNAARYPLAGIAANAFTTGKVEKRVLMAADGQVLGNSTNDTRRTHLVIKGPHVNLSYTGDKSSKFGFRESANIGRFVEQLNEAGRRLQSAYLPQAQAPNVRQPAAGWYPNPLGKPGQSYWDGQAWNNASLGP
jgi:uncharacterized membrane protein